MLKDIVDFLKSKTYKELQEMADEIGVSFELLKSIRLGRRSNPTLKTILAIKEKMD